MEKTALIIPTISCGQYVMTIQKGLGETERVEGWENSLTQDPISGRTMRLPVNGMT